MFDWPIKINTCTGLLMSAGLPSGSGSGSGTCARTAGMANRAKAMAAAVVRELVFIFVLPRGIRTIAMDSARSPLYGYSLMR